MATPESFRLITFFSVLILMTVSETFFRARPWQTPRYKRWLFHGFLTVFNTILTRLFFLAPVLAWLAFVNEKGWGIANWIGLEGLPEILATFVVFDLFDYWWHRFNHTVPFLWRFHRAHHADTHVDVSTSLRFHPGELLLSYIAKSIWILIWGPSLLGFLVFEAGITAYSQFHHSDIDFPDTFETILRWVHMTPRIHASHHTVTMRTRDANYSTIFLWWDRIFKTFQHPNAEELKQLGLPNGRRDYLAFGAFLKAPLKLSEG